MVGNQKAIVRLHHQIVKRYKTETHQRNFKLKFNDEFMMFI